MEGLLLPEGSGDAESPEEPKGCGVERALEVYEERLAAFERGLSLLGRAAKRRRFSDYTTKNCEEAWGAP